MWSEEHAETEDGLVQRGNPVHLKIFFSSDFITSLKNKHKYEPETCRHHQPKVNLTMETNEKC